MRKIIFGMTVLFSLPAAQAQEKIVRSVTVSGLCLRTVTPDRGSIVVTPDHTDMKVQAAVKKTTEAYEALKKSVLKLGLKNIEIQTSEYSVQEVRDWINNKPVFKGYRARMGLEVTSSEFARLGEVISLAANQKITEAGALRLFMSPEKTKTEREECLTEAIAHAKGKAEKMAAAAGAKLGRILLLRDGEASGPAPGPARALMQDASFKMERDSAPAIDSAGQKLSVSVDAVYALD